MAPPAWLISAAISRRRLGRISGAAIMPGLSGAIGGEGILGSKSIIQPLYRCGVFRLGRLDPTFAFGDLVLCETLLVIAEVPVFQAGLQFLAFHFHRRRAASGQDGGRGSCRYRQSRPDCIYP